MIDSGAVSEIWRSELVPNRIGSEFVGSGVEETGEVVAQVTTITAARVAVNFFWGKTLVDPFW